MRILITTPVWGERNRETFAGCSLASLLSPGNLPALSKRHQITFQVVTQRKDVRWLWAQRNVAAVENCCDLDMVLMEDRGVLSTVVDEYDHAKYSQVTRLQNIAIATPGHDAIVFNYADFVWSDGTLPNVVRSIDEADALLGFCLPVDLQRGEEALARFRGDDGILTIGARELAALCLDNLHAEATYRFEDAAEFTRLPSYLLAKDGADVTVRAYHQTALVARTRVLNGGIKDGTLDGDFTSEIARRGRVVHATDSDRVMVVSLHNGRSPSSMRGGERAETIAAFERRCTPEQIAFAQVPMRVSR